MTAVPAAPKPQTAPLLRVNNIEVIYDHVILVLKGVSLEVPAGGIVALLGANGAGKTTTLKAISNLLKAERGDVTKGSVEAFGERIDRLTASDLVKRGIIQVMDHPGDGRPPLLRPSHRRRESDDRSLLAPRREGRGRRRS
jgi:branched-chain amino acid transport system ATP-binding protein